MLQPKQGSDPLERALSGRIGIVDEIIEDDKGKLLFAITVERFPGFDLGRAGHPAHRFFFDRSELAPAPDERDGRRRILVAGIGNIFFGDDGFGVEVVHRLLMREIPADVDIADFGIRGMDLAYALGKGYHAAILVDAVPAGLPPGTLVVVRPEDNEPKRGGGIDPHRMDPAAVLELAGRLGTVPDRVFVVGCQPVFSTPREEGDGLLVELSTPVAASVEKAADMVSDIINRLLEDRVD